MADTTNIEHKMAMDTIGFAAQILTPQADYLGKFIDAEQKMHSYMHITDPTFYMKAMNSDGLRQQIEISKAALAFILVIQKIKSELAQTK